MSFKRSFGLFFVRTLPSCHLIQPDERQALVSATFLYQIPPFCLPFHLIQPRRATSPHPVISLQGLYLHGSTSPSISFIPDELQALVWGFLPLRFYLPYHLRVNQRRIQRRRVTNTCLELPFLQSLPFKFTSCTISSSPGIPDELRVFLGAIFSSGLSLRPHLPL
jgi:hypothetical protein